MPLFKFKKKKAKGAEKAEDMRGPSATATDTPPLPKTPHPMPARPPPPSSNADPPPARKKGREKSSNGRSKTSKSRRNSSSRGHGSECGSTDKDIEIEDTEPRMPVAVGMRRRDSSTDILAVSDLGDQPAKDARGALQRKASAKNVKLGFNHDRTDNDASVAGNFMHNIYSSPLEATLAYESPVYPKSEKDVDFISVALQRNFVFANALSDGEVERKKEMKQIVDAFEKHSVADVGVTILSAGKVGDYFYILKEGCVEYKNINATSGEKEVIGKAKRPGQSFGELCLLYDCPPPADCVSGPLAGGNVKCKDGSSCLMWRIHKLAFRQIMALRTMRRDERFRDGIRKIKLFQGLDDEFINRIANALDVRNVKKGETIYKAGDETHELFMVGSEGRVKITPQSGGKSFTLGLGESFGEEAIYKADKPRMETAVAEKKTMLVYMSREHLDRTIGSLDDAILLSKDRRLLKSIPLFRDSDFEDFEYELLAALIDKKTYRGGEVIYEEEEMIEEPALMIVRTGIVDQFSEQHPDRECVLKSGDYFGEESLTPDKNMKFGGPKGGTKYREETVEVVSDTMECGKLTLSSIDSVIQDLHRLGCNRRHGKKGNKFGAQKNSSMETESRPETLGDLDFHQLFGAGTFGRVWIVSRPGGKTAYALKIQSKRELLDQRQASSAKRERAVMAKLDHPFVCKLVNTFQDDACIYMLLSLIQGGELLNLIQGGEMHGGLPEIATKFYAAGILEGLTYMHRRHIVYRDLKPENVLLDGDGYPVIVDFGFSKVVTDKTYTFCGTPLYLAPEIVLSRGHDRAVDYWSIGCLIFEMLFGGTPFYERGIDQKGLFKNIVRGKWRLPNDANKLSQHAMDLIRGMLQKRPTERLGCMAGGYREVKHHQFFQEVNFNKLVKKQIKAPWVPFIEDALDISHFENFDADGEDFTKGKKPLTADEQIVFQDF
mmetsp:Transcript_2908/g.5294  ORF Transcript_2908/g.5294 Transcript_2908/m.5294 type:complete len:947 (+) Transcript_2908:140-2980(+)|eukprot:CAMPEP_0196132806 /NCGR_PEP_ID=MMETSP0910-20130528/2276_1 /TAXON_ID=49265 /ORGANISM="Thalassiosira rotula, Strain GSO102" /LENGTH=946 /DNA_ID=CAMNT_0041392447 /DNA_START=137 /DNA_END=2977 /DNA_ORIENTATION=+